MEKRNRNILIVVVIAVVVLCCLALAVGAGIAAWLAIRPVERSLESGWGSDRVGERSETSFDVGATPTLRVDNFAGDITIRAGDEGRIHVIATRRAAGQGDLQRISLDWEQQGDTVEIRTSHPAMRLSNLSVDLEIAVPAGTNLIVDNGAGNVLIGGVRGTMDLHTGAGNIEARGALGPVQIETGAGNVEYEGQPQGTCTFRTGAGNVLLGLPAGVSARVELDTGIGIVDLGGFEVVGHVSAGAADGVLGSGEGVSIEAHTGAGNIILSQR